MLVLVAGVAELFQGDLDLGRRAVERLDAEGLGPNVVVEELSYGAVAVAQRLEDLRPDRLVLITAVHRGRAPGSVTRRLLHPPPGDETPGAAVVDAVRHAVTGYVDVDLVVDVAAALGALPPHTVVIEVEPTTAGPSTELSPEGAAGLEEALAVARAEVDRAPLLGLVPSVRAALEDGHLGDGPAPAAMRQLLDDLEAADRSGRWGATFRHRDRVRLLIAEGLTGEGMDHLDWALWWAVVEELDRLEVQDVGGLPGS